MRLQESGEMYLETILVLSRRSGGVRSIDISEHMGVSKPSVSRAIGLLKEGGYITADTDGYLTLTEKGKARAEKIYSRHNVITELLTMLGVNPEVASEDACRIEHRISDESVEAISNFVNKNSQN